MKSGYNNQLGVTKAPTQHPRGGGEQNLVELQDELLDLVDLTKYFKVTKRTIFNWRAKNELPLFEMGGRLYITRAKLGEVLATKQEGAI